MDEQQTLLMAEAEGVAPPSHRLQTAQRSGGCCSHCRCRWLLQCRGCGGSAGRCCCMNRSACRCAAACPGAALCRCPLALHSANTKCSSVQSHTSFQSVANPLLMSSLCSGSSFSHVLRAERLRYAELGGGGQALCICKKEDRETKGKNATEPSNARWGSGGGVT